MRTSTFEKFLPWSGAVAGALWAIQAFAEKTTDDPAAADAVRVIGGAPAQNYVAGFALLVGALLLVLFAAAVRSALRSGEAGEAVFSSVAHGGLLSAAAGFAGMAVVQIALTNAAGAGDAAGTVTLGRLHQIGWLPALVGFVATFWGLGLGGLHNAVLPKWFAVATVVLGVVGVLGPLAIVVYLLLPVWLVLASLLLASRAHAASPVMTG